MNHCSATVNLSSKLPAARQPRDLDGQFFASASCTKGPALLWTFLFPTPLPLLVPLGLGLYPGAYYYCDGSNGPLQKLFCEVCISGSLKPLYSLGALSLKAQHFKIRTQHQNHLLFPLQEYWVWMLPNSRLRQGQPIVTRAVVLYLGLLHWYSGKLIFYIVRGPYVGAYTWSFLNIPEQHRTKIPNSPKLWQMPTNLWNWTTFPNGNTGRTGEKMTSFPTIGEEAFAVPLLGLQL